MEIWETLRPFFGITARTMNIYRKHSNVKTLQDTEDIFSAYAVDSIKTGDWNAKMFLDVISASRKETMDRMEHEEKIIDKFSEFLSWDYHIDIRKPTFLVYSIAESEGAFNTCGKTKNSQLGLFILSQCGGLHLLELLRQQVDIPFELIGLFEENGTISYEIICECFENENLYCLLDENLITFQTALRFADHAKYYPILVSECNVYSFFANEHIDPDDIVNNWSYDKIHSIFSSDMIMDYYVKGKISGDNDPDNFLAECLNPWHKYDYLLVLRLVLVFGLYTLKEVISMDIPPDYYIHLGRKHVDLFLDFSDKKRLTLEDLKKFPTIRHLDYFLTREVQEYYRTGVMTLEYIYSLTEDAIRRKGKTALRQNDVAKKKLWGRKLRK